jgi:hypothetical protein|tara:strand:- start:394 stop:1893 length:1500 start_codon:yes stop_codon:yes gene_type:complete
MLSLYNNIVSSAFVQSISVITDELKLWLGFQTSEISGVNQITPDLSGNSNVGQLLTGTAVDFDGSNDYISIGAFPSYDAVTIAISIKTNSSTFGGSSGIIGRGSATAADSNWAVWGTSSGLAIYVGDGTNREIFSIATAQFTADSWDRLVIRIDYTAKTIKAELNNVNKVNDSFSLTKDSGSDVIILGALTTSSYFEDCALADFQIYNSILSDADVTYDYAKPNHLVTDNPSTSTTIDNLKGYWALSEGTGAIAYDSSGESRNGTISSAVYIDSQPSILQMGMTRHSLTNASGSTPVMLVPNPANPLQDIVGGTILSRQQSLHLSNLETSNIGTGHAEVVKGSDFNFGTGDFTLETWVQYRYENTGNGFNAIMGLGGQGAGAGNASAHLLLDSSRFYFSIIQVSATSGAGLSLTEGDWYHVVGVRDGTSSKMYVDGDLKATVSNANGDVTNSNNIQIGVDSSTGRYYKGLIDDCRIYNKALSQDEITNNYNAGLSAHSN